MPPKLPNIAGRKRPSKRSAYTISAKMAILKELDNNPKKPRNQMAERLKISASTLQGIIKNRQKIEAASLRGSKKRQKLKVSKYPEVEKALLEFINQARSANLPVQIPLQGPDLKTRAKEIALCLGIEGFTASDGWLNRFRKRNQIVSRKVTGEDADVQAEIVDTWKISVLPNLLRGYARKDQFSLGEFGLSVNLLPEKCMCRNEEQSTGNNTSKFRVTVLLGSNADGSHKLEPLVIGKLKQPRCFIGIKSLPCTYTNQSNACMNSYIFRTFLRKFDAQMRTQKRKVILFVDNCTAHPGDLELTNVKLEFFPNNCTSKLHPMVQGIIKNVKHHYRTRLVQHLITFIGKNNVNKKDVYINLYQALHFLMWSWNKVTHKTITNCFRKSGFREVAKEVALPQNAPPRQRRPAPAHRRRRILDCKEDKDDPKNVEDLEEDDDRAGEREADDTLLDEIPIDETIRERWVEVLDMLGVNGDLSFSRYVANDDGLPVFEELNTEAFANMLHRQRKEASGEEQQEEDYVDNEEARPPVSLPEVMQSLDVVRRFLCQQECAPKGAHDLIMKLDNIVLACQKTKQTTITDFFKPV